MDVRVIDHPLAAARLTTLRDERTNNASFRDALRDLTLMLVYEATRDAAIESIPVRTPVTDTTGSRLANNTPRLIGCPLIGPRPCMPTSPSIRDNVTGRMLFT